MQQLVDKARKRTAAMNKNSNIVYFPVPYGHKYVVVDISTVELKKVMYHMIYEAM